MFNLFKKQSQLKPKSTDDSDMSEISDIEAEKAWRKYEARVQKQNMNSIVGSEWEEEVGSILPKWERIQVLSLSGTLVVSGSHSVSNSDKVFLALEIGAAIAGDRHTSAALAYSSAIYELTRNSRESVLRGGTFLSSYPGPIHRTEFVGKDIGSVIIHHPVQRKVREKISISRVIADTMVQFDGATTTEMVFAENYLSLRERVRDFGMRPDVLSMQAVLYEKPSKTSQLMREFIQKKKHYPTA